MPSFATVDDLREFAGKLRTSPGIIAIPAQLYRDLVISATRAAVSKPDLAETDERFLRVCCRGVEGMQTTLKRSVYVPAATLYRLSRFKSPESRVESPEPTAAVADAAEIRDVVPESEEPRAESVEPAKPKRRRKKKDGNTSRHAEKLE